MPKSELRYARQQEQLAKDYAEAQKAETDQRWTWAINLYKRILADGPELQRHRTATGTGADTRAPGAVMITRQCDALARQ